ncbi:helix-turn-helix domain-containing protein [Mesorhizobium sp.]|uniref:helix-turn-helix domain-containing protein n=1 Tax=Mesorhizobium sp. TaxID=1871066 RepID=UPI00257FCE70|nr:helix-turn-helix domain-containing protein [Mesorhizobium sp.]
MIISDDTAREAVQAVEALGSQSAAAELLNIARSTLQNRLKRAAERGMMGFKPVLPGFRISQTTSTPHGDFVQQKPERSEQFEMPAGQKIKGVSALVDPEGREIIKWIKTDTDREQLLAVMRAAVDALKEELPRVEPTPAPGITLSELLNLYAVTDAHFGMLSWREETGADYDLPIAEKLLLDWFAAAIDLAPPAETAIFAQIGDLLHYDGFESKTPTSGHILDADSRLPKVIRVVIRTLRRVIAMLLEKHQFVHVIMADANHDPASEAWLREMFAAFYDNEPRVTVDSSASTYYAYQHGDVSLFVHHGHKRKIGNVDTVFAGKFREMYGQTKFSYAHLGHLHSDELKSTNLMKVERHETLAAPDAYASNGGWLSGRSAKVITYSKKHGEVARLTLTPGMVGGYRTAANDNEQKREAA